MKITYKDANKYLKDVEQSEIYALEELYQSTDIDETTTEFIRALFRLEKVVTKMKNGVLPYDEKVDKFYQQGLHILHKECDITALPL